MQRIGESPGSWRARHDRIPPELTGALYAEVKRLAETNSSPVSIARQLSVLHSLSLDPGTVRHWVVGDRNPLIQRSRFNKEPSRELSYIIGSIIGDGCIVPKEKVVKLEVADRDFAEAFNTNMARLFSRRTPNRIMVKRFKVDRLPLYVVRYCSGQLERLLESPLAKLLEIASVFPREFLRGLFDAEGHVDVGVGRTLHLTVGAENSDRHLLLYARRLLDSLGIDSRIYQKRRAGSSKVIRGAEFLMKQTSYSLVIGKIECMRVFAEEVGFSISRKLGKMQDAIRLIDAVEAPARPRSWVQLYSKEKGEWIRRERHA